MNKLKRFTDFKSNLNENNEEIEDNSNVMSVKEHTAKIMNALYGMDEKYEDTVVASYNEDNKSIRLVLDTEEEIVNIMLYLTQNDYNATDNGLEIIIIL